MARNMHGLHQNDEQSGFVCPCYAGDDVIKDDTAANKQAETKVGEGKKDDKADAGKPEDKKGQTFS